MIIETITIQLTIREFLMKRITFKVPTITNRVRALLEVFITRTNVKKS